MGSKDVEFFQDCQWGRSVRDWRRLACIRQRLSKLLGLFQAAPLPHHTIGSSFISFRDLALEMDYRRVEKADRRCACSLQIALIGSLAVYVSLQFSVIISSAHSVPVKISMEEWENAGVWAICDGDIPPFGLHGVGLELQNDTRFGATLDIK